MKPKISIIIPCYNSENYILRCAESLINQTIGIENLELIFVNDGSTDNTLKKLYDLESLFPQNILVINLDENQKQGAARNIGLQYSNADYIGYIDSDDWIEREMYEKLYLKIQQLNCDVVGCCLTVETLDEKSVGYAKGEDIYLTINSIKERKSLFNADIGGGIVTKIYRKSLLVDNQILFPEKLAYEDNYWISMVKLYIKSIYIINENLYHYCINEGSTTQTFNANHHLDRLKVELLKLEKYKQEGLLDIYYNEIEMEFLTTFYENTLHILLTKFSVLNIDVIHYMQEVMKENFPNFKKNPYINNKLNVLYNTIDKMWDEEHWNEFASKYRKILSSSEI